MFIDQLTNADALPTLGAMAQFSARRQVVLQHNIANISTPNFKNKTVSVEGFQDSLKDAIRTRRTRFGGHRGDLNIRNTRELEWGRRDGGRLKLNPTTPSGNIMFHDRNNRDVERMMQDLAENVAAFRVATELMKMNMEQLASAIREQP